MTKKSHSNRRALSRKALHTRVFLHKWHRRIGLSAAILTLILCITGILLNHTDTLQLSKKPITSPLLLKLYKVTLPEIKSFQFGKNRVSHLGGQQLFLNNQVLALCDEHLSGAIEINSINYIACDNEIIIFNRDFEQIERVGAQYGLPSPIHTIGHCGTELCISSDKNKNQIYQIDTNALTSIRIENNQALVWSTPSPIPKKLKSELLSNFPRSNISLERVLLDLHSGRLFGGFGVMLMDFCAIALAVLVASGFWLWWRSPSARR